MSDNKNNKNNKKNKKNNKKDEEQQPEPSEPLTVPAKANPKTPFNTPVVTSMPNRGGKGKAQPPPPEDDEDDEQEMTLEEFKNHFSQFMRPSPDEFLATLPAEVQTRVKVLNHIQGKYDALRKEFYREVKELEQKYDVLYQPLFARRTEIVNGSSEPTEEEVGASSKIVEIDNPHTTSAVKGIPEFWLTALQNEDTIADSITERDIEALKFLKDITYESMSLPESKAFKLTFHFAENSFFSNTTLTKTYYYVEEDELLLDKAEGTTINWKSPEQNLTVITVKKKQRQKGSKNVRTVTKTEPCDSFFNFFSPPSLDQELEQDEDDDEQMTIEDLVEADFEMGQIIKERVIPKAVDYFTGKAVFDEEMKNAFMGGEDDEEDDDDEDDDEEEEEVPKKGKGGRRALPAAAAGDAKADNPECKQQ